MRSRVSLFTDIGIQLYRSATPTARWRMKAAETRCTYLHSSVKRRPPARQRIEVLRGRCRVFHSRQLVAGLNKHHSSERTQRPAVQ